MKAHLPCDGRPSCCTTPQICSEAHRQACEARYLLTRDKAWRKSYYEAVAEIRGQRAAEELIEAVKREHAKANQAMEV